MTLTVWTWSGKVGDQVNTPGMEGPGVFPGRVEMWRWLEARGLLLSEEPTYTDAVPLHARPIHPLLNELI